MADRGRAERVLDQRVSDILAIIQQAILNGSRCFETDDVDGSGILMELRQSLRNLQRLHINPENARQIEAIVSLIDQIEMKMQTRLRPDPFIAQRISTPGILLDIYNCLCTSTTHMGPAGNRDTSPTRLSFLFSFFIYCHTLF